MSIEISVRLPNDMAKKLSEVAEQTERAKSFHIQKALELYLTEIADLQVAYDRLHDGSDPVIAIDDIRSDLEL
jgi:RHH-type transcriptional regulator, rel operon repressor / antitoxin RelB